MILCSVIKKKNLSQSDSLPTIHPTKFFTLHGKIPSFECPDALSHCSSQYTIIIYIHMTALFAPGQVIISDASTHLVCLQICQWYRKHRIEKQSMKFWTKHCDRDLEHGNAVFFSPQDTPTYDDAASTNFGCKRISSSELIVDINDHILI